MTHISDPRAAAMYFRSKGYTTIAQIAGHYDIDEPSLEMIARWLEVLG